MSEDRPVVHSIIEISMDPNRTTAFVSFTRPENGGIDISVDKIMAALNEKNISFGVLKEAITKAVERKLYNENICVARWEAPEDGIDGEIRYFYKPEQNAAPVENEYGIVDYKNLGLVRNITKGTPIATISFPTDGKPGTDITGRVVLQKKGVPVKLNIGVGTSLVNDGAEIIASVDGNLSFKNGAFCVDETLIINGDVDISSGNIDFIGSVTVKGSVFEGFRVTSKKDINVFGSVNNAELYADGNITIKIGSINSSIECRGDAKFGYCENSNVKCKGNVESSSFVGGNVFAGKKIIASGKGVMLGGKYTALDGVEASVIGSDKYVKTELTLGNNAILSEERDNLEKSIIQMEGEIEQLTKIIDTLAEFAKVGKLSPERENMKTVSVRSRIKMQSEIKKNKARIEEINKDLELMQNVSVSAKRMIYPGVRLRINSSILVLKNIENNVKAIVDKGEIIFVPLR
ncbi:MAG: DUF342 domain-containing protein [Oscillospiraceae bacterium]|nr:DUF342 domain-containing protein [Oscillospiraceae bacterium]